MDAIVLTRFLTHLKKRNRKRERRIIMSSDLGTRGEETSKGDLIFAAQHAGPASQTVQQPVSCKMIRVQFAIVRIILQLSPNSNSRSKSLSFARPVFFICAPC